MEHYLSTLFLRCPTPGFNRPPTWIPLTTLHFYFHCPHSNVCLLLKHRHTSCNAYLLLLLSWSRESGLRVNIQRHLNQLCFCTFFSRIKVFTLEWNLSTDLKNTDVIIIYNSKLVSSFYILFVFLQNEAQVAYLVCEKCSRSCKKKC